MPRNQQKAVYANRGLKNKSFKRPNRNQRINILMNTYGYSKKEAVAELEDMGEY